MSDRPSLDLTDPQSFAHWVEVSIRFSDQDPLGHVNNVSFAQYAEQGRVNYYYDLLTRIGRRDLDFLLASVKIDYKREAKFPGIIRVGTRVIRIGNTSVTSGLGMFKDGACVATAESVNVFMDIDSGKPVAMPPELRAALEAELSRG